MKTLSPETAAIFFSADHEANKAIVLAAVPKVRSFVSDYQLCEILLTLKLLSF